MKQAVYETCSHKKVKKKGITRFIKGQCCKTVFDVEQRKRYQETHGQEVAEERETMRNS